MANKHFHESNRKTKYGEHDVKFWIGTVVAFASQEKQIEEGFGWMYKVRVDGDHAVGADSIKDEQLSSLYEFGKNIGLAFQVVDDILDFTGNDKQLGKPAVSDLASGYLTAPVLYALEENKQLSVLINRELAEKDDLDDALNIIMNSKAIESSRKLAEDFAMLSKEAIVWLPDSEYKRALMALPEFVLSRIY